MKQIEPYEHKFIGKFCRNIQNPWSLSQNLKNATYLPFQTMYPVGL